MSLSKSIDIDDEDEVEFLYAMKDNILLLPFGKATKWKDEITVKTLNYGQLPDMIQDTNVQDKNVNVDILKTWKKPERQSEYRTSSYEKLYARKMILSSEGVVLTDREKSLAKKP